MTLASTQIETKVFRLYRVHIARARRLILLLFFSFASINASADSRTVILDPEKAPFDLAKHADYFIEQRNPVEQPDGGLTLPELIKLAEEGAFKPVLTPQISFEQKRMQIHLRVQLKNPSDRLQTWTLAFNQQAYYVNIAQLLTDSGSPPNAPFIQTRKASDWVDDDIKVHGEFELPARSSGILYISYSNGLSAAPLTIETTTSYENRRRNEDTIFYIFAGLIIGLASIVVILMTALRHRATIPYTLYITSAISTSFLFEGYLFRFGWPANFQFQLEAILINLSIFSLYLFQRAFLAEQNVAARYRSLLLAVSIIPIILTCFQLLYPRTFGDLATIIWGLLFALSPITGVMAVKSKLKGGIALLLGSIVVSVSVIGFATMTLLSAHYTIDKSLLMLRSSLVFEVIMFSLALFSQVRGMRMETEAALRAEIKATQDRLAMAETLASTAHDMQQPLVSLRIAMQRARAGSDTIINSALDYLDDVLRRNLTNLQTVVTQEDSYTDADLLATVQPQKAHDIDDFEISIVFDRTLTMFQDEASAKCLELHVIPSNFMARGSPLVLMRIVSNLVSNAIKNTDKGSITLRCNDQDEHLLIEVCDTGKGISPEIMPQIQKRYQRAGCYEGLGLGLAIVHQLCDEYGLKFNLSSKPRRGTVASILIPKA